MSLTIIIEGPDNVGKGTLIRNIKNHWNNVPFQNLHFSNVKQTNIEDTISYNKRLYTGMFRLAQALRRDGAGVICDRSHLGELVYGPIYRGYDGEYVLDIENEYIKSEEYNGAANNTFLIVLVDEPENLIARDDGLSFSTDLEKKLLEIERFKIAFNKSNIKNKILLNINNRDEKQVLNIIKEFIGNG